MPISDRLPSLAALALIGVASLTGPASPGRAETPDRVVSLNLCTDQMAMLLAAPGQLVSVSQLASDPRSSAYAEMARDLPHNRGSAEEIVLIDPDLVLAGTWTTRATVQMLERLGYRVEIFAPVTTLDEARANIARMGALLGRAEQADALLQDFDARRAALETTPEANSPRALIYQARGYVAGANSLSGNLLTAAGLTNIATERGLDFGGAMPLEALVMADPDLILIGAPYGGHANATELLSHPALAKSGKLHILPEGAPMTCETPRLLDALESLVTLRQTWETTQ